MPIKIIYPYIASKWGEELKYSLRSVEKHFQEDFEVWIMGEKPSWMKGVRHVPTYNKNFLQVNKCRLFDLAQSFPEDEEFIWMNDDIYFLKPLTFADLDKYYYLQDVSRLKNRGKTAWHKTFFTTIDFCRELGYTQFNFECHIPMTFKVEKLLLTFERFSELEKWCIISAYRNMHMDRSKLIQLGRLKTGYYTPKNPPFAVHPQSIFLNHDDRGLRSEIKELLPRLFPDKSRFEK